MQAQISLSDGVQASMHDRALVVRGPQGELRRDIPSEIAVHVADNAVQLDGSSKALVNTYAAHIRNMQKGAKDGFKTTLKILFAHFPITVEVKGTDIIIKNFLGEKQPRKARLFPPTQLTAKGPEATLQGPDKEALGQTLASIRKACYIGRKDPRVFQDGFYVVAQS